MTKKELDKLIELDSHDSSKDVSYAIFEGYLDIVYDFFKPLVPKLVDYGRTYEIKGKGVTTCGYTKR